MAAMVAVDEFELGVAPVGAPAAASHSRERHRDRPDAWVALAVAAVGIGAFAAPPTLPRASAELPQWGGLDGFTSVMVDDDVDAISLAREALGFFASFDAEGRPTGTVVVVLRRGPGAPDELAPGQTGAVLDTATGDLATMLLDPEVFTTLEAAAYRSDWVCEPSADHAICTALADPEITVVVDPVSP